MYDSSRVWSEPCTVFVHIPVPESVPFLVVEFFFPFYDRQLAGG